MEVEVGWGLLVSISGGTNTSKLRETAYIRETAYKKYISNAVEIVITMVDTITSSAGYSKSNDILNTPPPVDPFSLLRQLCHFHRL